MKKIFLLTSLLLYLHSAAQDNKGSDAILGTWLTGEGLGKVEIYKNGEKFQGRIVWLKEPLDPKTGKPKTDINHPDKSVRNREILGLVTLWGFVYNGKDKWENGHVYDPKNGKEYKCVIRLKNPETLEVRGYIGVTLIGRTDVWLRVKG